jgi:phage-related baseplate assembly protein
MSHALSTSVSVADGPASLPTSADVCLVTLLPNVSRWRRTGLLTGQCVCVCL